RDGGVRDEDGGQVHAVAWVHNWPELPARGPGQQPDGAGTCLWLAVFHGRAGGRSAVVAASVLAVRSSRGLYYFPARRGHRHHGRCYLRPPPGGGVQLGGAGGGGDGFYQFYDLGPPYVHGGPAPGGPGVLFRRQYGGGHS